jgi:hypothetical protein
MTLICDLPARKLVSARRPIQLVALFICLLLASEAWCQPYQYRGGAVIRSPKVVAVYWGVQAPGFAQQINQFYSDIVTSPYFDRLGEYGVAERPRFVGSFDVRQGDVGQIDTVAIARRIDEQILNRALPFPDDNTIYMVHFGTAVVPAMGTNIAGVVVGADVGQGFCAYHFTARVQVPVAPPLIYAYGPKIRVAVIPDASSIAGCNRGSKVDTATFGASHELVETMTNPDSVIVAMRPVAGETLQCDQLVLPPTGEPPNSPWGWASNKSVICNPDEIADQCMVSERYKTSAAVSYSVTKIWQNSVKACTTAPPTPPGRPPRTPREACIQQCVAERDVCLSDANNGTARGACVRVYSACQDRCPR